MRTPRVELVFKRLLDLPVSTVTLADLQRCVDGYDCPEKCGVCRAHLPTGAEMGIEAGACLCVRELLHIGAPAKIKARERVLVRMNSAPCCRTCEARQAPMLK